MENDKQTLDSVVQTVAAEGVDIKGFRQFVFLRAKNKTLQRHPEWEKKGVLQPGALTRLSEGLAMSEILRRGRAVLEEFLALSKEELPLRKPKPVESQASASQTAPQPDEAVLTEVDKKVGPGGQTKLIMAACRGNLVEVKRLVTEEKANVHVRDNSGMTAEEKARMMGFCEVVDFFVSLRTIT
jgi:hypothetical protein